MSFETKFVISRVKPRPNFNFVKIGSFFVLIENKLDEETDLDFHTGLQGPSFEDDRISSYGYAARVRIHGSTIHIERDTFLGMPIYQSLDKNGTWKFISNSIELLASIAGLKYDLRSMASIMVCSSKGARFSRATNFLDTHLIMNQGPLVFLENGQTRFGSLRIPILRQSTIASASNQMREMISHIKDTTQRDLVVPFSAGFDSKIVFSLVHELDVSLYSYDRDWIFDWIATWQAARRFHRQWRPVQIKRSDFKKVMQRESNSEKDPFESLHDYSLSKFFNFSKTIFLSGNGGDIDRPMFSELNKMKTPNIDSIACIIADSPHIREDFQSAIREDVRYHLTERYDNFDFRNRSIDVNRLLFLNERFREQVNGEGNLLHAYPFACRDFRSVALSWPKELSHKASKGSLHENFVNYLTGNRSAKFFFDKPVKWNKENVSNLQILFYTGYRIYIKMRKFDTNRQLRAMELRRRAQENFDVIQDSSYHGIWDLFDRDSILTAIKKQDGRSMIPKNLKLADSFRKIIEHTQ